MLDGFDLPPQAIKSSGRKRAITNVILNFRIRRLRRLNAIDRVYLACDFAVRPTVSSLSAQLAQRVVPE